MSARRQEILDEALDQARWCGRMLDRYEQYRAEDPSPPEGELEQRLAALLIHCGRDVPAFRAALATRERAVRADPLGVLQTLPTTTKTGMADALTDHVTDTLGDYDVRVTTTSGTSGRQTEVFTSVEWMVHLYALRLLRTQQMGLPWFHKVLRPLHWMGTWLEYSAPALGLARVAQSGRVGPGGLDAAELADATARFQPDLVSATPSNLLAFVDVLDRTVGAGAVSPRCLSTSGEQLTASARTRIESFFQLPVLDLYSMAEVGSIAHRCLHGSLHVEARRVLVETLDEQGRPTQDGHAGRLVVTDLLNEVMPHVRYETGDIGVLEHRSCACGRSGPLLARVDGRRPARILLPDGDTEDAFVLTRQLMRAPVSQFQLVQTSVGALLARITPNPDADGAALAAELRDRLSALLNGRLDVQVEVVGPSGYDTQASGKSLDFVPLAGPGTSSG